jgi:hypothetical protein
MISRRKREWHVRRQARSGRGGRNPSSNPPPRDPGSSLLRKRAIFPDTMSLLCLPGQRGFTARKVCPRGRVISTRCSGGPLAPPFQPQHTLSGSGNSGVTVGWHCAYSRWPSCPDNRTGGADASPVGGGATLEEGSKQGGTGAVRGREAIGLCHSHACPGYTDSGSSLEARMSTPASNL